MSTISAINRDKFFDGVRDSFYGGKLSQGNVNGMNAILEAWEGTRLTDKRWLSYILATAYHETAKTMQPVEEYGKGAGRKYGNRIKMDGTKYNLPHIYYGRGFVQLTWYENYYRIGKLIDEDMLNHPELALNAVISARILVSGMIEGWFTGRKLGHYLNADKTDNVNARKIINGLDQADRIASYAVRFYMILKAI